MAEYMLGVYRGSLMLGDDIPNRLTTDRGRVVLVAVVSAMTWTRVSKRLKYPISGSKFITPAKKKKKKPILSITIHHLSQQASSTTSATSLSL